MQISGSIAVITGASSGIGAATARALAARGAQVLLLARRQAELERVAAEVRAKGGQADCWAVDLADPAAVDRVFDQLDAAGLSPGIVVNSAGAGRWLFTEETEPAEAVQQMAVPYFAAFFVTRRCLPAMLRRRAGHIVNINSPAAYSAWPGAAGYTAARYALYGYTAALRVDLHGMGVKVTSVVAGRVASDYFDHNQGVTERLPKIGRLTRIVTPAEVALAVMTGIEHNRREVVLPASLRVFLALNTVAPRLIEWFMIRTGWRHPPVQQPTVRQE
jgi:short-subunit dehydrogenase